MHDDAEQAHDYVQHSSQDDYDGTEYGTGHVGHAVEGLRYRKGCHADCEQSDVAHDVAEAADRIQEAREETTQSGLQTGSEALAGLLAAEHDNQEEADRDTDDDDGEVDTGSDDQIQRHHGLR